MTTIEIRNLIEEIHKIENEGNVDFEEAIEILKIVELRRINEILGDSDHERIIW